VGAAAEGVGARDDGVGPTDKLFVVTRADLPPGSMGVQAMHAFRQFVHEHREAEMEWFEKSNHLAFLEVRDERALERLAADAAARSLRFSAFREPDLGGSLTALALEPAAKRLCGRLKLALREPGVRAMCSDTGP